MPLCSHAPRPWIPCRLLVFLALPLTLAPSCTDDPVVPEAPGDGLDIVAPEDVGWSAERLVAAELVAAQYGFAAVVAVYDGQVFFSWGDVSTNFRCHSIRKPFLSALYGIHSARGELRLDATLEQLGVDDIPPSLTPEEKLARVEHLLQARSGVYHEAAAETEAIAATRPPRGSHPPGTFHDDNNWDFNAAGTVFCQETARDIFATFAQEIASPIHRQDFEVANGVYECETGKSLHPADAIRMSARDLARFGVLYQREGTWLGRQVVPQEWIAASTTAYSVTDSLAGAGYGYMWNVIIPGGAMAAALGSPGYYHPGLGAHALIVLPELKLVIVERVDTDGPWTDPGEAGLQLVLMIINARGEAVP